MHAFAPGDGAEAPSPLPLPLPPHALTDAAGSSARSPPSGPVWPPRAPPPPTFRPPPIVDANTVHPVITTAASPEYAVSLVRKARTHWLTPDEIHKILHNFRVYGLQPLSDVVERPPSGSLLLFEKSTVRNYRKDKHEWRCRKTCSSVAEYHMKLTVNGRKLVVASYAKHRTRPKFVRRLYRLVDDDSAVLVHKIR